MKKINFQAMLKQGFLIIPKALVQQQIEDPAHARRRTRSTPENPDESQLFGYTL